VLSFNKNYSTECHFLTNMREQSVILMKSQNIILQKIKRLLNLFIFNKKIDVDGMTRAG
jgi:hypothetical protein